MGEAHRQRARGGRKGLRKLVKRSLGGAPDTQEQMVEQVLGEGAGRREHRGQSAEARAGDGDPRQGSGRVPSWRPQQPQRRAQGLGGWEQIAKG